MPEAPNPCVFKNACRTCVATDLADRPYLCLSMACNHYTPCTRCGMNRTLDDQGVCNVCVKKAKQEAQAVLDDTGQLTETQVSHLAEAVAPEGVAAGDLPLRILTITSPGSAPQEYTEPEKEYYSSQWQEYQNYYHDPTAKAICHHIIILEVELNWLAAKMIEKRGAITKEIALERNRLIKNLGELRSQLPQKEASDESDDERFMSMVYERYCAENAERKIGKVHRLFSQEALAIAPRLDFPVNPTKILQDLGYKPIPAMEACSHILLDDLPQDPVKMLEFLGFFLAEKFALSTDTRLGIEDEETLPAIGSFQTSSLAPELPVSEVEDLSLDMN